MPKMAFKVKTFKSYANKDVHTYKRTPPAELVGCVFILTLNSFRNQLRPLNLRVKFHAPPPYMSKPG